MVSLAYEPPLLNGEILKACRRDMSFALETAGGGRSAGRREIGCFELILIVFSPHLEFISASKTAIRSTFYIQIICKGFRQIA